MPAGTPSASLTDRPGTELADDPQAGDDEMIVHPLDPAGDSAANMQKQVSSSGIAVEPR